MKKQTAVEWLAENVIISAPLNWDITILEQAKEMEKQQIISVIKLVIEKEYHEQTWSKCGSINYVAENYYNEIFKNTDNETI
jgi:hypothetical protein